MKKLDILGDNGVRTIFNMCTCYSCFSQSRAEMNFSLLADRTCETRSRWQWFKQALCCLCVKRYRALHSLNPQRWYGFYFVCSSIELLCLCDQWLKQIDSTEAALTQKMMDLENEKVGDEWVVQFVLTAGLVIDEAWWQPLTLSWPRCSDVINRSCSVNRKVSWKRSWTTGSKLLIMPNW